MKIRHLIRYATLLILMTTSVMFAETGTAANQIKELTKILSAPSPTTEQNLSHLNGNEEARNAYINQLEQRRTQELQRLTLELKRLKGFIAQNNYREANNTLQTINQKATSLDTSGQAAELIIALSAELVRLESQSHLEWYTKIEALVGEAREQCLAAEKPGDLDPLLIRVAALEMKRPTSNSNALYKRGDEKIKGVIFTLQQWMRYLDHRWAENPTAANEKLRELEKNKSIFPILRAEDLDAKWLTEKDVFSETQFTINILSNTQGYNDLQGSIDALQAALENPKLKFSPNTRSSLTTSTIPRIESLKNGFEAFERGEIDLATSLSESIRHYSGQQNLKPYFERLQEQLATAIVVAKIESITGEAISDDNSKDYLLRHAADSLMKKGEFQKLLEILKLDTKLTHTPQYAATTSGINCYLAAQRFESAGDQLAAYVKYTAVIAMPAGDTIPHEQAIEATKRLRTENPELLEHFDQSAVVEQLNDIRNQLKRLSHSSNRRF